MPATVRVAVVWLVYVDPAGVPLDTVAQPLVPFEEYSQTGVCVPVPPDKLDVRFTEPPTQMVVKAVGALNAGSATTLNV